MLSRSVKGMKIPHYSVKNVEETMTTEDAINLLKNLGEIDDNELVDFTLSNETKYLLNKQEYNFENIDNSFYTSKNLESMVA